MVDILDEKNQLIPELAEDRDRWTNTAEDPFKRDDSRAYKEEKWKAFAMKQGEKLRAFAAVATKRSEKIRGFEEEAEIWWKKMIELERVLVRLRAGVIEDNERIKELLLGILDAEKEVAEKGQDEVEEVKVRVYRASRLTQVEEGGKGVEEVI